MTELQEIAGSNFFRIGFAKLKTFLHI